MPDMYSPEYRPLGSRFGGGNNSYRLAQLLSRQNYNNGSTAGGLATVLQGLMQGLAIKGENDRVAKEATDTTAANNAMVQGMTAQPWKLPAGEQNYSGPTTDPNAKPVPFNAAPAGGYEGGLAALQNLGPDNAPAGRLAQSLLMNKVGRDQQLADTADNRGFQEKLFGMQNEAADRRQSAGFQQQKDLLGMQPESFGAPVAMMQNGQQVMVQVGNRGSIRPMNGFSPITENKLPAGYVLGEDGKTAVPIPGTKGAQELSDQQAKDAESLAATDRILRSTDTLTTHPGRETATGMSSIFNKAQYGTDAASFLAQLDTMKSQSFLPMVAQLKGMGALSDAEGKKLTDAIGALDPSMKEEDFLKSLHQIESDLVAARSRMPGGKTSQYVPPRLDGAFGAPGVKPAAPKFLGYE
jgi:hypothetical protein